jgi:hypothetical protein
MTVVVSVQATQLRSSDEQCQTQEPHSQEVMASAFRVCKAQHFLGSYSADTLTPEAAIAVILSTRECEFDHNIRSTPTLSPSGYSLKIAFL